MRPGSLVVLEVRLENPRPGSVGLAAIADIYNADKREDELMAAGQSVDVERIKN